MGTQTATEAPAAAGLPLDPPAEIEDDQAAMPLNIRELLDGTPSSTELRTAIERIKAEGDEVDARLDRLERPYEEALVAEDKAEVDRLVEERRTARRNAERCAVILIRLEDALEKALAREDRERLEALEVRAQAAQAAGVARIEKIGKRAGEIADLLRELAVIEGTIVSLNNGLRASNLSPVASANQIARCRGSQLIAAERTYEEQTRPIVTIDGRPAEATWKPETRRRTVPEQRSTPIHNRPLEEAVVLPPMGASTLPVWGPGVLRHFLADREAQAAVRRKLGLDGDS